LTKGGGDEFFAEGLVLRGGEIYGEKAGDEVRGRDPSALILEHID